MSRQRNLILNLLRTRPRLLVSIFAGIATAYCFSFEANSQWTTRLLIGWNTGVCLFVVLAIYMMTHFSMSYMHGKAQIEGERTQAILALVVLATITCLIAIAGELSVIQNTHGILKFEHIILTSITVVSY